MGSSGSSLGQGRDTLKACDHVGLFYQDDVQRVGALARLVERAAVAAQIGITTPAEAGSAPGAGPRPDIEMDPLAILRALLGVTSANPGQPVRIVVDMTWALGALATPERLLQWEAQVHSFLEPGRRAVVICQYDRRRSRRRCSPWPSGTTPS